MKEPYIADLAKYENQVITGFFAATSRQDRSKRESRDESAYEGHSGASLPLWEYLGSAF